VLFRSFCGNFQDFYGQVIALCGLRLKFDRHAIILVAMEARCCRGACDFVFWWNDGGAVLPDGRDKFETKVKDARLKRKSRRPLQIQRQRQMQRQRRPPEKRKQAAATTATPSSKSEATSAAGALLWLWMTRLGVGRLLGWGRGVTLE